MHIEISTLFGIIGGLIGIITFLRSIKKEGSDTGTEIAAMKSNIDYIVRGIDDIRLEQRTQATKIDNHSERLIRAEENIKEMKKKIEKLEGNNEN